MYLDEGGSPSHCLSLGRWNGVHFIPRSRQGRWIMWTKAFTQWLRPAAKTMETLFDKRQLKAFQLVPKKMKVKIYMIHKGIPQLFTGSSGSEEDPPKELW